MYLRHHAMVNMECQLLFHLGIQFRLDGLWRNAYFLAEGRETAHVRSLEGMDYGMRKEASFYGCAVASQVLVLFGVSWVSWVVRRARPLLQKNITLT